MKWKRIRGAMDRRTALKGLGATAVAPWLAGCPGPSGDPPEPFPTELTPELLRERIDTVVVLMMENRSFDHYFGAYSLLEGREAVDGLTPGMSNPRPDGGEVEIHPADATCIPDPPHGWTSSHDQFAGGSNTGFVSEHYDRHGADEAHRVMGYFDRETLSTFYALADAGTLCDRWFCSLMTSTWPNRFYSIAAQNGGVYGNGFAEDAEWPSIFDRVAESGRSWANYFGNLPFSMLMHNRGLGDPNYLPLEDFFADAQAGLLPSLVWIDPIYGRNDDHPPCHPVAGQVLISSIYEALATGPHWERCLFLVYYDEHGGFFDHVPPPLAADARAKDGFDQLGFRVPALLSGPWVKEGHVSSRVYDHSSLLAFLEGLWELEPLSERDAAADPMMDVLDIDRLLEGRPAAPIQLPVIEADDAELYAPECAWDLNVRSDSPPSGVTGQPELEAVFDGRLAGSLHDRREQTDRIYEDLLDEAVRLGVLRRDPSRESG
ncbi:MAG: alkaline phosphatase family protein [Myxococcota bacterium]|nr:alkaline phosphatase family protein [Myxococcota bacterium]